MAFTQSVTSVQSVSQFSVRPQLSRLSFLKVHSSLAGGKKHHRTEKNEMRKETKKAIKLLHNHRAWPHKAPQNSLTTKITAAVVIINGNKRKKTDATYLYGEGKMFHRHRPMMIATQVVTSALPTSSSARTARRCYPVPFSRLVQRSTNYWYQSWSRGPVERPVDRKLSLVVVAKFWAVVGKLESKP